jgi:Protein of unknown function (DUF1553)/Protein of unknown function (DUF1549)/Concanavalin A-like lectin/glucanases superfamily/Planctomycete cytochrome C
MRSSQTFRVGVSSALCLLFAAAGLAQEAKDTPADAPLPGTVQFNRDIRPILSNNCFTCHGPDKSHRVTLFHFDVEESAKQDIGHGRLAIAPGDPEKSILIQRVTAPDPARRMPPASTGHKLTERQIALLKEWIVQGAKWEKHWAFMPPKRPEVPQVADAAWVRNPIDSFVLHRLEQEGMRPSPEADRATLLRRVTLDLIGKPPTPADLDAFLADKSPSAYEKVVDRLLQSPQYGERMALPWLDAARYADTDGYQVDFERFMWRWRDWVINAFNKNEPYDKFTVEQLAGDLLPNSTLDQKIATAFNRNVRTNGEGGIIPQEFAAEYVVDRVATTSSVFLGVTMGCARCHDHKYDPFSQKEFYQLFAYFNNVPEPGRGRKGNSEPYIKAPTPDQQAELKKFDDQIAQANARFTKLTPVIESSEAAWLKSLAGGKPVQWTPSRGLMVHYSLDGGLAADPEVSSSDKATPDAVWKGNAQFSGGVLGKAASFDGTSMVDAGDVGGFEAESRFTLGAWIYPTQGDGAILTRTADTPRERGYSLILKDGKMQMNMMLRWDDHGLRVETEKPIELNRWHHVAVSYGGARAARSLRLYVDGEPQPVKVLLDILNESQYVKEPFRIGGGGGPENRFHGQIEDVRIYNAELTPEEVGILADSKPLNELALVPAEQRSKAESNKIRSAFLHSTSAPAEVRDAFAQVTKLEDERARYNDGVSIVMVMEDMPTPRESHILLRGAYDQPGEKVTPGVPAILPAMPSDYPRNRLGLARWLVDPSNPLTARVAVNRYWQMYFGTGIVKTVDDFGSQGESPSHPELLDWLATQFIATGWDVKQMQKLIVTSATYRQTSAATPETQEKDPENRLLARGPRFRMPAEIIRDQALSIAGLLVEKVGGPSVKIYQPEGLWADLTQGEKYVQDHGDGLYRRSLYTFWKRTIPPPSMANFDSPSRESCVIQRGFTNSPLQALDLMNDVTYLEAARVLAQRMIKEGGKNPEERITFAFRLATSRPPNADEYRILSDSFRYILDRFQTKPESAEEYLKVGEYPRDPALDVRELAAYTNVASLILNLDETVTKE